jgi:hypothetical protein
MPKGLSAWIITSRASAGGRMPASSNPAKRPEPMQPSRPSRPAIKSNALRAPRGPKATESMKSGLPFGPAAVG